MFLHLETHTLLSPSILKYVAFGSPLSRAAAQMKDHVGVIRAPGCAEDITSPLMRLRDMKS